MPDVAEYLLIAFSLFALLVEIVRYLRRRLKAKPVVDPRLATKARVYAYASQCLRPDLERAQKAVRTAEVDHSLAYEIELLRL